MAKSFKLDDRLDLATGAAVPMAWDPKISRALQDRRRQEFEDRGTAAGLGIEQISARLASAREELESEEDDIDLFDDGPDDGLYLDLDD